jgi:hypothetical protein
VLNPPGPSRQEFPYQLAFREVGTDHYLDSGALTGGKRYKIYLRASEEYDFEVSEPYGKDTYILLTSEQPVGNPDIFEFDGVRSKGAASGVENPLTELLEGVGRLTHSSP